MHFKHCLHRLRHARQCSATASKASSANAPPPPVLSPRTTGKCDSARKDSELCECGLVNLQRWRDVGRQHGLEPCCPSEAAGIQHLSHSSRALPQIKVQIDRMAEELQVLTDQAAQIMESLSSLKWQVPAAPKRSVEGLATDSASIDRQMPRLEQTLTPTKPRSSSTCAYTEKTDSTNPPSRVDKPAELRIFAPSKSKEEQSKQHRPPTPFRAPSRKTDELVPVLPIVRDTLFDLATQSRSRAADSDTTARRVLP